VNELVGVRRVELEGAPNFRDLGGYPSVFGGATRWGMLFRAGRLDLLTPDDLAELARLGISTVYDLRRDDERLRAPDPLPSVHVCLLSEVLANADMPDRASLVERDHGVQFMRDMYVGLLAHAGAEIGRIVAGLADSDALPAVFHCTAGKDRTGVVAALILSALGVDRETVLDDFELTGRYVDDEHEEQMFQRMLEVGMGPEAAAGMLATSRRSMAAALDALEATYGGAEAYLVDVAGVDAATLSAVRSNLLA
jgi:protein-tyrosine phosphatase